MSQTITLQRAQRSQAKLKIGIFGASGSGKTLSSLLMAYGLVKAENPGISDEDAWAKICIIDTENASGSLYVDKVIEGINVRIGTYNTIMLVPPYEAKVYIEAIHVAEQAGMSVIIIDSLTHAWSGEGGALDTQGKIASRTGNSYTAWREVTPLHNRLVDSILQSSAHIIADIRAKTEYVQEKNDKGKTTVRNIGLAPIFRDGIEYEFTCCFMLDTNHVAAATKDRTGLFDKKYFTISPDVGADLYRWLSSGKPPLPVDPPVIQQAPQPNAELETLVEQVDAAIKAKCQGLSGDDRRAIVERVKEITGGVANYRGVTDMDVLRKLYDEFGD